MGGVSFRDAILTEGVCDDRDLRRADRGPRPY